MRERILQILQEVRHDVDFENERKLIDNGVLDSFDLISIVSGLDEKVDPNNSFCCIRDINLTDDRKHTGKKMELSGG